MPPFNHDTIITNKIYNNRKEKKKMLRITDLAIDPKSLGGNFLLADITPSFAYENGERTKNIDGYRYHVVLPKLKMEKIGVKVPHKIPLIDVEKEEIPVGMAVDFSNLQVGTYFSNGNINLKASADDVILVGKKNA